MLALLSRKESFSWFGSLAVTLEQELRVANFIEMAPTPAKASRMLCLPANLLAMYSQML